MLLGIGRQDCGYAYKKKYEIPVLPHILKIPEFNRIYPASVLYGMPGVNGGFENYLLFLLQYFELFF